MKAVITRIEYHNLFEKMGDDTILIHIFHKVDDGHELPTPALIHLDSLINFTAEIDRETYKYLKKIQRGIHGYGPQDSKVMAVLEEENFDIEKYISAYFSTLKEDFFQRQIEINKNTMNPDAQKALERKMEELDALIIDSNMKNNQNRRIAFLNKMDKAIHEATFEFYPEIFEIGDKHEYAYKNLLVTTVLNYADRLYDVRTNKFSEYFEAVYKRYLEE